MSHGPIMPFENPEAARAFLEQQHQEFRVQERNMTHKVGELLDALNADQLHTLDHLLAAARRSKHVCGYVRGQIDLIREQKFNICRCGTNHDEEIAQEFTSLVPEVGPDPQMSPEEEQDLMGKYRVMPVPADLREVYPTEYRCADCFTPIVSLQDRMLRNPGIEGCSGCQQASGTGIKWYGR